MEFNYNQTAVILLKDFKNHKVGSKIIISKSEAKQLIKNKIAYLADSFYFDSQIKIGLILSIIMSILIIITLNILLLFSVVSMLSLFLIVEIFYVLIGSIALFMLTKTNRLTKKQLLLLGSFTIIGFPFFWKGKIIFKETKNNDSKKSTPKEQS